MKPVCKAKVVQVVTTMLACWAIEGTPDRKFGPRLILDASAGFCILLLLLHVVSAPSQ